MRREASRQKGIGATIVFLVVALTACSSDRAPSFGPPTPLSGRLISFSPIDDHRIVVRFSVRNQGTESVRAGCVLTAFDPAGNTTSNVVASGRRVQPNTSTRVVGYMPFVDDTARSVKRVTVGDCRQVSTSVPGGASPGTPTGPNPPATTAPAGEAADRATMADLRNAFVAAKVFFTDSGTYTGFDPGKAAEIEPSLHWAIHGAAAPGVVTIDLADGPEVVLSELSTTGAAFCLADSSSGNVGGTRDAVGAMSSADCSDDAGWLAG